MTGKLPYTQQSNACRAHLLCFTLRKWAPALFQVTPDGHINLAQAQQWPQSRQTFGAVRGCSAAEQGSGHAKNNDVSECISPHVQNRNEELRQNYTQKQNGRRTSLSDSLQTSSTLATAAMCPRCDSNATQRSAMSIRARSSSRMTPSHTVTYRRDSRWVRPTLQSKAASSTESYHSLEGALRRQTAPLTPKAPPQPVGHHLNSHTYSAPPPAKAHAHGILPAPPLLAERFSGFKPNFRSFWCIAKSFRRGRQPRRAYKRLAVPAGRLKRTHAAENPEAAVRRAGAGAAACAGILRPGRERRELPRSSEGPVRG